MKVVFALITALGLSTSMSLASNNPELTREIERKVIVDLSSVELNDVATDYVVVSFRIINSQVKISEISGTSRELKDLIIKELYDMHIDSDYNENQTYQYRFTFELR